MRKMTMRVAVAALMGSVMAAGSSNANEAAASITHVKLASGLDMAYQKVGSGPVPIVFIHGYSLSSAEWEKVLPLFPADKFTSYAIDLRGFGDSGKPKDGNDFKQLVVDVKEFVDRLELKRPVLVGHSMGGSLLQDFSVKYPTVASALVLSDAFARNAPPSGISESVQKRLDGYGEPSANRTVFESAMPHYFDAGNVKEEDIARFVDGALKASNEALKGLLAQEYTIQPISLEDYSKIKTPTLLLFGAHDTFVSPQQIKTLTDNIPGLVYTVTVPRSGHIPMWEQPRLWSEAVTSFLDARALVN